jgi:hypothetical protein
MNLLLKAESPTIAKINGEKRIVCTSGKFKFNPKCKTFSKSIKWKTKEFFSTKILAECLSPIRTAYEITVQQAKESMTKSF